MDLLDISEKPADKGGEPENKGIETGGDKTPESKEPAKKETLKAPVAARSSEEDIARKGGWKPAEEWDGDTNAPENFISAELFNERGKWIGKHKQQEQRLKEMESSFDTRLNGLNKIHNIQLETQKSELIRKRDEAIDLADRETANKIQDDIDKLVPAEEPKPAANPDQQFVDDWNSANPWVMGNTPKAAYARSQFSSYNGQGMSVSDALAAAEADINREFPTINPKREAEPLPEGGSPPGKKVSGKKLSMSDLTHEEKKFRQAMPGAWKDDKEFLQAVADSRSTKQ